MKNLVIGFLVVIVIVGGWGIYARQNQKKVEAPSLVDQQNPQTKLYPLSIGSQTLQAEVRRTAEEQMLGLSYRTQMGEDQAMAFVYDRPQQVMYWMKGMKFPLDFIWVNEGKVVEFTENVQPPTVDAPTIRRVWPAQQVDMVIEVNAGWVKQHGVQVGDEVGIKL